MRGNACIRVHHTFIHMYIHTCVHLKKISPRKDVKILKKIQLFLDDFVPLNQPLRLTSFFSFFFNFFCTTPRLHSRE